MGVPFWSVFSEAAGGCNFGTVEIGSVTITDGAVSVLDNCTGTITFGNPIISESGEDPRSEARRWLDECVEEVRGLAWQ